MEVIAACSPMETSRSFWAWAAGASAKASNAAASWSMRIMVSLLVL
jgi:hypothetical protein